jgi:hypothetical protein
MSKLENIAVITSLFDYPNNYTPSFFDNAKKYFKEEDIHIVRNSNLIKDASYYDKLYFYKIPKVLEYIKENIVNKYKYILFLDATDTNFYRSPKDIENIFLGKQCSILFGAEKGLWPISSYTHLYEKIITEDLEYKYLNSGTYFGYTDKVISHMTNIIEKVYDKGIDDQGKWTIEYLLSNDIKLDYDCSIFMSSYNSKKHMSVENGNVEIKNYNPIIVHDNGPSNDETIKIVDLL